MTCLWWRFACAECSGVVVEVEQGVAGRAERRLLGQVSGGIHEGADQGALQWGRGAVQPWVGHRYRQAGGLRCACRFPGDVEVERFGQVGGRPVPLGQGSSSQRRCRVLMTEVESRVVLMIVPARV